MRLSHALPPLRHTRQLQQLSVGAVLKHVAVQIIAQTVHPPRTLDSTRQDTAEDTREVGSRRIVSAQHKERKEFKRERTWETKREKREKKEGLS
jgi:hypothetical protein